ncbi:hypothetical protein EDD18DRAFT_505469 [Armillaria luteobubalina]|uniref:Heterokaryon incompatibility domain-containing protein n=1 Tax=Armillaria luteobubalina TaxID=153913 RepID=A0AA39QK96_9AGAR|nr:hypothetical protein EDD18DRAFT_505469 [Armillaria luteobubalina]
MHMQELPSAADTEGKSHGLSEQASDSDEKDHSSSKDNRKEAYTNLPKVTLTSLTETGQDELTIPVLKQRSYTGIKLIQSALADTLCADLGVNGVLEKLNTILGTSYTLDSVISILNPYIAQGSDFGTAYAYLRRYWNDIQTLEAELRTREAKDREMRRKVLVDGKITERDVPPRRVWDLYANRVIPYWVARPKPWAISHAWVAWKDRVDVMTPINGREWPVPMPKDAKLDLIRIEMLNARLTWAPYIETQYIWLDVLCLRQDGGEGEHLRLEEWKLDVPTIGSVYEQAYPFVVCYFNGLGRPLHLPPGYFESDRCWFRRAWTLQEITDDAIIGGETGNYVMDKQVQRRFDEQMASLQRKRLSRSILDLVSEMQRRESTKPLDKVAGLVYLLETKSIPIYDTEKSAAEAWDVLVDVMDPWFRGQLLLFYPEPGDGSKCWRPSWPQLMTYEAIAPGFTGFPGNVWRENNPDADLYVGSNIQLGNVRGLSEVPKELKPRQGELVLNDDTGAPRTLTVVADHAYPIPDGVYTVIGWFSSTSGSQHWIIGQLTDDGMFKKLSVFRTVGNELVRLKELAPKDQVELFLC